MTSKISASSKGLSCQFALSPDILEIPRLLGKVEQFAAQEYKFIKNWVIQSTIIPWSEDKIPSTIRLSILLFLLLELTILWKNLVFASPSLKWSTLDFYLQLIYSKRVSFSISVRRLTCSIFSSAVKGWFSSLTSKSFNLFQSCCFLKVTLPNSTSFHFFRSNFKVANFLASIKLIGLPPSFHFINKIFNPQPHIFKMKRCSTSPMTPSPQ